MSSLQQYIIRLKDSATETDVAAVKQKVKDLGGSIVTEFSLIKAFAAKLPSIHTSAISNHDHVDGIEEDQEVHTQ